MKKLKRILKIIIFLSSLIIVLFSGCLTEFSVQIKPSEIAMISKDVGILLSHGGKLVYTGNGWKDRKVLSAPSKVVSITKINRILYLVDVKKMIYRSIDGKNWRKQGPLLKLPKRIQFVSPNVGFATFPNSKRFFAKTIDCGETWRYLTVKRNKMPQIISFASQTVAFAIDNNFILKSEDGGVRWFNVLDLNKDDNKFTFLDTQDDIVAAWEGLNSQLALSFDQGRHWNEDQLGTNDRPFENLSQGPITSILLLKPKTVFISNGSRIDFTFDGAEFSIDSSPILNKGDVQCLDSADNNFFAVTDIGFVLKFQKNTGLWKEIAKINL